MYEKLLSEIHQHLKLIKYSNPESLVCLELSSYLLQILIVNICRFLKFQLKLTILYGRLMLYRQ